MNPTPSRYRSTIIQDARDPRPRTALLALAADLDDLHIRARLLSDDGRIMSCWDSVRQGKAVRVVCAVNESGRLRFRDHRSGEDLGDAEYVLQPGTAAGRSIAQAIAVELAVRSGGR